MSISFSTKSSSAFFAIIAIILSSCAPKVTVNTIKDYPKRVGNDMVTVYNIGDTVPQEAEYIGNVMVTSDRTHAEDCRYEKVLNKAVKATSEYGGNILALTSHKEPGQENPCHEVSGNIMWLGPPATSDTNSEPKATFSLPKNTVYFNAGLGHITSDLRVGDIETKAGNDTKNGFDFQFGYDYMFNKYVGIGALYSGFKSSAKIEDETMHFMLNMVGGQILFKQHPGNGRFVFEERMGIGYMNYLQWDRYGSAAINGFGAMIQVGAEYLFTPQIGIALNVGSIVGTFDKNSMPTPDGRAPGIERFVLGLGFRYHF